MAPPQIHYTKLFEENRDGDQGKFAETLRDQQLYDVMSTYPMMEDAIRRAVCPTLRMQLQPVFHCSSLNALDPGSGREIPAICHDPGAWHGHFTPES